MKNIFKIILILMIIIGYVISINTFASLISFSYEQSQIEKTITSGGSIVKISVGTSVSVKVTRVPKWYGRFNVDDGKEYLNLFYLCNLPYKIKNYNFIYFHLIFLIILILFTILIFTKRKVYKEENLNLENEKCLEDSIGSGGFSPSIHY